MTDEADGLATRLVHAGRDAKRFKGTVNPPIQKGSTLIAETTDDLYGGSKSLYGRMGLAAQECLKEGLCTLENAQYAHLASNGLNACALALASVVNAGDHLIVSDGIYGPTRRFCEKYLSRMGVEITFIPPRTGVEIETYIKDHTKAVFLEMPCSLTFELGDPHPILTHSKSRNIITLVDNTWAAGVFFKPLDIGFDVSIQALTKYVIGHSDGFGGAVMTNNTAISQSIEDTAQNWGISLGAEDAYLAQRGLRSLKLRMTTQGKSAAVIARFLNDHPAVQTVLFPALSDSPDHQFWSDYYSGASGLFGFVLHPAPAEKVRSFFSALRLFSFGFSWGGFESLMIPCDPQLKRSQSPDWFSGSRGQLIRVSIGLEDTDDLISDLQNALQELS